MTIKEESVKLDFPSFENFSAPYSTGSGAPKVLKDKNYWKRYFQKKVIPYDNTVLTTKTQALLYHILNASVLNPASCAINILDLALQLPTAQNPNKHFFFDYALKYFYTKEGEETVINEAERDEMQLTNLEPPRSADVEELTSDKLSEASTQRSISYDEVSQKILHACKEPTTAIYIGPIICCALLGGASRQAESTASRIVRLLRTLTNFFPSAKATNLAEPDQRNEQWIERIRSITGVLRGCIEYRQFAAICVSVYLHADSNDGAYKAVRMCALMLYHREGYGVAFMISRLAERYSIPIQEVLESCGIRSMLPDIHKIIQYIRNFTTWVETNQLQKDEKYKQSYYFCRAVDDDYDNQLSGSVTWRLQALLALWIDKAEGSNIYEKGYVLIRNQRLSLGEEQYADKLLEYYETKHNLEKGTEASKRVQAFCKKNAQAKRFRDQEDFDME